MSLKSQNQYSIFLKLYKQKACIISLTQRQDFSTELKSLNTGKPIPKNSSLASLNPFLHSVDTMRVGGRLEFNPISFDQQHPVILPSKHHITTLIVRHYHELKHHVRPQGLLAFVRQKYWPLKGLRTIKSI